MRVPAEFVTYEGIQLRRWRPADAEVALRIVVESMDHLRPWMDWAADGYGPAEANAFLAQCDSDWDSGAAYNYAIVAPDGEVAGSCGLMAQIGPGGLEIGYWLRPRYTGRGLVTRAAAALTAEAFLSGADRVEIIHDQANTRSAAVPRRLRYAEMGQRPAELPGGTASTGVVVAWRRAMGGGVRLRPATGTDVPGVLAFWRAAAEDAHRPADSARALDALLARDPDALLLAADGEDIVGSVIAGWDGWRCHLYRLAVAPTHRGRGIGRTLIEAAEQRLRRFGGARADAMVLRDNDPAHKAWRAYGYAEQAEWSRWVRPL